MFTCIYLGGTTPTQNLLSFGRVFDGYLITGQICPVKIENIFCFTPNYKYDQSCTVTARLYKVLSAAGEVRETRPAAVPRSLRRVAL